MASSCTPSMTAVKFILGIILVVTVVLVQQPKLKGQPEPDLPPGFEMASKACGLKDNVPTSHYQDLVRAVRKELVQHTHQRSYNFNYQLENKCFGYSHFDVREFSNDQCISGILDVRESSSANCLHIADVDMERARHFSIGADIISKPAV